MAKPSLIIIDDFYPNPDEIRELALSQEFSQKEGATYPGLETYIEGHDWEKIREQLKAYIPDPVDAPCPKDPPFLQGKFRLAWGEHEETRVDKVHVDQQRWSGVVYLSKTEDCRSGLIFYKHKPTNSRLWVQTWMEENKSYLMYLTGDLLKSEMLKFMRDPEQFEEIGVVPIQYNRAIVFMAHVFHGTGLAFGHSRETGRLTQHFEFYTAPEWKPTT